MLVKLHGHVSTQINRQLLSHVQTDLIVTLDLKDLVLLFCRNRLASEFHAELKLGLFLDGLNLAFYLNCALLN